MWLLCHALAIKTRNRSLDDDIGQWDRKGHTIEGESNGGKSNRAVDLNSDGTIAAIGTTSGDTEDTQDLCCKVRVYGWAGSSWVQMGDDINNSAIDDDFGRSVSLNTLGNILAVGAPFTNNEKGHNTGIVLTFQWTGFEWLSLGNSIEGQQSSDQFGHAVSLSADGRTVAVGAIGNADGGAWSGSVYIYALSEQGVWLLKGSSITSGEKGAKFGFSISISADGNTVAAGAPYSDGNGPWSGNTRVYKWSVRSSAWSQLGNTILGVAKYDNCGYAVSLSSDGTTLAVGARYNDGNGNSSGQVRVFSLNPDSSKWEQKGNDIYGENTEEDMGSAVSLSGDGRTVAVGSGEGHLLWCVRVYRFGAAVTEGESEGGIEAAWQQIGLSLAAEEGTQVQVVGVALSYGGDSLAVCIGYDSSDSTGFTQIYQALVPTQAPTAHPTGPSYSPTMHPSTAPTTVSPSSLPTFTAMPTTDPTWKPTVVPTTQDSLLVQFHCNISLSGYPVGSVTVEEELAVRNATAQAMGLETNAITWWGVTVVTDISSSFSSSTSSSSSSTHLYWPAAFSSISTTPFESHLSVKSEALLDGGSSAHRGIRKSTVLGNDRSYEESHAGKSVSDIHGLDNIVNTKSMNSKGTEYVPIADRSLSSQSSTHAEENEASKQAVAAMQQLGENYSKMFILRVTVPLSSAGAVRTASKEYQRLATALIDAVTSKGGSSGISTGNGDQGSVLFLNILERTASAAGVVLPDGGLHVTEVTVGPLESIPVPGSYKSSSDSGSGSDAGTNELPIGTIIGGVVAAVVVLILLVIALFWYRNGILNGTQNDNDKSCCSLSSIFFGWERLTGDP